MKILIDMTDRGLMAVIRRGHEAIRILDGRKETPPDRIKKRKVK